MRRRRENTVLGYEELQSSIDRDESLQRARLSQAPRPSTSEPLSRCATCGQWPRWKNTVTGALCIGDGGSGHPYQPALNRLMKRMGEQ